ncbi:hypothetical protein BKM31_45430 [[Actinomadura] parvosata subsp. kistnae]|uniref:Uncharacterized protein n=1 Tax=[Actinomadura] parvosata subsp. kistnae TaxID=1909395 RepID=A0A1V0AC35_9ACTN|nr:hypothetical protein BKM31_45430 [Nonomuraea sp. ATCC 55076]
MPVSALRGSSESMGQSWAALLILRTVRPTLAGVLPTGMVVHLFSHGQYSRKPWPSRRRLHPMSTQCLRALLMSLSVCSDGSIDFPVITWPSRA